MLAQDIAVDLRLEHRFARAACHARAQRGRGDLDHAVERERFKAAAEVRTELLCLREGMAKLGQRLTDCTLFVTLEPCAMCAGACVNAKLGSIVFGAFDEAAGCCGSKLDLTDDCFLYSVPVWGGILEEDCKALLTRFFQALR